MTAPTPPAAAALPHSLPYGLRKVVITPYTDANGTILSSTSYQFPIAQTLSFSETEEFDELRGDDRLAAIHGRGAEVDGSIEGGGISIQIWSLITGGQIVETGTAPNRQKRLKKKGTDARPYFRVDGQMISDSGGDVIARIYRCKCNGKIQAEFRYGQFQITSTDFKGTPLQSDGEDWLYEIIQNETKTTLSLTPEANPLPTPSNLGVGVVAATEVALTWDAVATATGYKVEQSADGKTWTAVTKANGGEPTTNSTKVTGLTTKTAYYFHVKAILGGVDTGASAAVTVTTS
jgi:hypothetical protein